MKSLLFSFQGRLNRAPYWYVHLVLFAVQLVFLVAFMILARLAGDPEMLESSSVAINLVSTLVFIPMFWASLAVTVKRCHDRDKSGWWMLIMLVPVIGGIWFLIDVGFLRGTYGPNRFGPDPLGY